MTLQCRSCGSVLSHTFVDLGSSPAANSFLDLTALSRPETFYPLHTYVCENCFLVQLPNVVEREDVFSDYLYFSSYSDQWLAHSERYVAEITVRLKLGYQSRVVELASNDGYLLQYFKRANVPALGVEPAENVAAIARSRGIETLAAFFGVATAQEMLAQGGAADLIIANNVIAHVPDLHDFVGGIKTLLKPDGTLTVEFPHLLNLIRLVQYDTIYHEHFSYYSLFSIARVFERHGLFVYDVEELPTHGGSLRVYVRPSTNTGIHPSANVADILDKERRAGLHDMSAYAGFTSRVTTSKLALLSFLVECAKSGKTVAGYGAPAKGNTMLNYCGVRSDLLGYTVDRNEHKQGKFLPGSRIPVFAPEEIARTKPDYLLILPWNVKDEVIEQMQHVRTWGGQFAVAVPELTVLS